MAQWKETLEPYIKVQERIKTAAIVPTAGEDLIIGAILISDAGPSTPTLITSQTEFLKTYASEDVTEDYAKTLNKLYKGEDKTIAETTWLNAYRLAGSVNMLVVRASKANDIYFSKSLVKGDNNTYILRDGQLLKSVREFKVVIDVDKDSADHSTDGWAISVSGVGVIGNRTTDEGAQYDYYVQTLPDLVDYLNDTPVFFSPSYDFYSTDRAEDGDIIEVNDVNKKDVRSVVFHEVYLGANFLDLSDTRVGENGISYIVTCEPDWTFETNELQKIIDLSGKEGGQSNFKSVPYYATNVYNASNELKVRIRRFNHDAVVTKELSENDANPGGESPFTVLTSVLDTFTKSGKVDSNGVLQVAQAVKDRDFYEIAVYDPSVSENPEYYNIGNIEGRGDMTIAEFNKVVNMVGIRLPDNLSDLGLNYFGYTPASLMSGWKVLSSEEVRALGEVVNSATAYENYKNLASVQGTDGNLAIVGKKTSTIYKYESSAWVPATPEEVATSPTISYEAASLTDLGLTVKRADEGEFAKIGSDVAGSYYQWKTLSASDIKAEEIYANLGIDPEKYHILDVTDTDMVKALDQIEQNEIYVVEGLTDLGNTSPMFQTAMVNMAANNNYFYPVSTINSTNYLAIANSINRISRDSYKLYANAPWDVDTGTVGFKFYASPAVLFWESVGRNRLLNREFADVFGQTNGIAQYQNPVVEFNKKTRQLLLSKRINTVLWNTQTQAWNWNESTTKQSENNIMSNDGNSRLFIRISKVMPVLLRQFIGRRISEKLWKDATTVIDQWFKNVLGPLEYGVDAYRITIDETNNDDSIIRANKMQVLVEVRYQRSLKYVIVYNTAYDIGMDFTGTI